MESSRSLLSEYRDSTSVEDECSQRAWESEKGVATAPRRRYPGLALLLSLLANVGLIVFVVLHVGSPQVDSSEHANLYNPMSQIEHEESLPVSDFASLKRNIPKQWTANAATTPEAWDETWLSTPIYPGIISLSDTYARGKGLPRSQRWPWDEEKGIYVVNAYHNYHCVLNIKQYLEESREGRPLSVDYSHVQHCLLVLRDEIMCNADDTPRYSGFQDWGKTGYGQTRMCRNWTQLEEWTLQPEQEGCWRPIPGILGDKRNDTSNHLLERYRFCSDQNPYKEKAQTMWTDPSDWEELETSEAS